jgi:hypothetical protein
MSIKGKYGRLSTRGPQKGYCNICDCHGPLTNDHVPPKGTMRLRQVDMLHITDLLRTERTYKSKRFMQSGMGFRSLCPHCNNELLGAKYDPALIHFSNSIAQCLKSALALPEVITVAAKPGYVARALLGHLMAIGIERRQKGTAGEAAVKFFLDDNEPLPEGLDIYYWVYPYRRQIAIRDASMSAHYWQGLTVFWALKYFPLGFLVTWDKDPNVRIRLSSLRDYMVGGGSAATELPVAFTQLPRPDFPEGPSETTMVLYGEGAVGALPKSRFVT